MEIENTNKLIENKEEGQCNYGFIMSSKVDFSEEKRKEKGP